MAENVTAPNPSSGTSVVEREQPRRLPNAPNDEKQTSGSGGGKAILGAIAVILLLGILLAVGIIPRLQQTHKIDARAHEMANAVPKVPVTKPGPAPDSSLTLPGSTEAIADAQVGARTTGYVTKRYVDIGAHVHAGQVLAEIESPDVDQQLYQANAQLAQSQATVAQSQADVANKQATVAQYRSAVKQAQANLEQARAQLTDTKAKLSQLESAEKTAEAQHEQAQANVGIKQAALKQANTQLSLAELTYQRNLTLQKSGYVALQDVDQAKANYENAQSAVNSAQSDLNASLKAVDAAEAGVRSAQSNVASGLAQVNASEKNVNAVQATVNSAQATVLAGLANVQGSQSTVFANRYAQAANQANSKRFAVLTSFEKVTAPFDGVITARNIDVGSLVNAGGGGTAGASSSPTAGSASTGTPSPNTASSAGLFGIARTDVLRIFIPVPQAYAPAIHTGLRTRITLNEFPGQTFEGTVAHVAGALDSISRTLLTEVHIPNRNQRLLPGMFAQVTFDVQQTDKGVIVPATAVIFDSFGTRLVVVGPQNKLHFTPVRVGRDFNIQVEIVEGIRPGDTIVASPSDDLTEGEKIEPIFPKPGQLPTATPSTPGMSNPEQKPAKAGPQTGNTTAAR